ncbi:right-handed parallel beta-helix repeat-containing protein [Leptospira sp. 96542]|nr:right-handed parallel beta-helix repeat-containing protein [Leptospira sp. 96542]
MTFNSFELKSGSKWNMGNKFINHLLILVLFFQFNCFYNPIVRKLLELDSPKNNEELWKFLPLLYLATPLETRISPSVGNVIRSDTQIQVVFNRSMDTGSFSASLGTPLNGIWSQTVVQNDTVTLSGNYPIGNQTFLIEGNDIHGIKLLPIRGIYTILSSSTNIYYANTFGNDTDSGTDTSSPKQTVSGAISGAVTPAAILIAEGDYFVTGTTLNLVEGVSLYGGFNKEFTNRNSNLYISKIIDTSTLAVGNSMAITAGGSITSATVVDGFTIQGASNPNVLFQSVAFACMAGSPTIRNNRVLAGNVNTGSIISIAILVTASSPLIIENPLIEGASGFGSFGIFIDLGSAPTISLNAISGGNAIGSSHALYTAPQANNPIISGNTIFGGTGQISYGLNTSFPSNVSLVNNSIDGGLGNTSYAIYHGTGVADVGNYTSNVFTTSGGGNRYCLFEAGDSNPMSVINNQFLNCPQGLYFDEGTTAIFSVATINGGTVGGSSYTGNF